MITLSRVRFLPFLLSVLTLTLLASVVFYLGQLYAWKLEKQASTRFFQQSFRAALNQYEYLPALLAYEKQVKRALSDVGSEQSELNTYLKFVTQRSKIDTVYIMNISGTVIATSHAIYLHQNYAFRPYFANAINQRKRQFYYAVGVTTGIPGLFISEPVKDDAGVMLGVVVVKLTLSEWEQRWQDAGQNILVADNSTVVILSGQAAWRYRSIGQLPQHQLAYIRKQRQFPGIQIQPLYSNRYDLNFLNFFSVSFWVINDAIFLANTYPIIDTGWTLFYLEEHQRFIQATVVFSSITVLVFALIGLYWAEHQSRLRAKQRAKENEARYHRELETIIEKIHIGIVLLDQSGDLLFMNETARQMLNIEPKSNCSIAQVVDVSALENFTALLMGQGDIVKPFHETTVLNPSQSPTHVMFAISRVAVEGHERLLMTLVNIEKRKQAEQALIRLNASLEEQVERRTQALRDAQDELVQQSKAAALGQMAATIVHELSQPLSAMNSSIAAMTLKAERQDWSGVLNSIKRLLPLNKKMHDIVKLLKSFSYRDNDVLEPQNLVHLLEQSLRLMQDNLLEKNITLAFDKLESSVYMRINPLKFDLVITNIIQNAMDAMEKCDNAMIKIALSTTTTEAILTIEDLGGGINSRMLGQLFDPYFTTKEIGKGLGLGLSICHEIVREYGGRIQVENTQHGAKFIICLPL